jgi:uncharacterized protein YqjF (DUF2071 family)
MSGVGPWLMTQTWQELLFAHWPVPADELRPRIPPGLELDTFDGEAWIGVVPFTMTGIRFRRFPALPGLSGFHEVNVRTYVRRGDRPGVWFLSLDAPSRVNAWGARRFYHLPYFHSRITLEREGDSIRYASRRTSRGGPPAELRVRYGPSGGVCPARPGSLDAWLTERYRLYSADATGRLYRAEVEHPPWALQPAWVDLGTNTMALAGGVRLPDAKPLLHFSRRQETLVWAPERCDEP